MYQDINLIPQTEVQEQTKVKLVKVSTIVSIGLLVLVSLVSAYFFYSTNKVKNDLKALDSQIDSLKSNINSQSDIEVTTRNLDKKFSTLNTIMKDRPNYSVLMKELRAREPDTVLITTLDVRGTQMTIAGYGVDYVSISSFITNLLNQNYDKGDPALKNMFKSVILNSVSLESKDNRVVFSILVDFDNNLIKK